MPGLSILGDMPMLSYIESGLIYVRSRMIGRGSGEDIKDLSDTMRVPGLFGIKKKRKGERNDIRRILTRGNR